MKRLFTFLLMTIILFSCKKPEDRICFKSTGNTITKEIHLGDFDKLILNEHLTYSIIQDSLNKVILNGGENLLSKINLNLKDNNTLEIKNTNKCNFLRNYSKKINVEIHLKTLVNIEFIGTDTLSNLGTLKVDYLTLVVKDGAGTANLKVDAKYINAVVTGGYGDFILQGKTDAAKILINGNGFCNTNNLTVKDSIICISNTVAPLKINCNNTFLNCQIKNNGDVLYKGSPSKIEYTNLGKGKLTPEY